MRDAGFVKRSEEVDLLSMLGAETGGDVEVLSLDVEYHQGVRVIETVGNDDADPFAGTRRCSQDDELVAAVSQITAVFLPDQDSLIESSLGIKQPGLSDFSRVGKACCTMQRTVLLGDDGPTDEAGEKSPGTNGTKLHGYPNELLGRMRVELPILND